MSEVMVEVMPVGTAQLKLGLLNAQAATMNKLDLITQFHQQRTPARDRDQARMAVGRNESRCR